MKFNFYLLIFIIIIMKNEGLKNNKIQFLLPNFNNYNNENLRD